MQSSKVSLYFIFNCVFPLLAFFFFSSPFCFFSFLNFSSFIFPFFVFSFFSFFSHPSRRQNLKKSSKSSCCKNDVSVKNGFSQGVRNGSFESDPAFMFFICLLCWKIDVSSFSFKYVSLLVVVSEFSFRCSLCSGKAGIGLGHHLGESIIQLPRVEWRAIAC